MSVLRIVNEWINSEDYVPPDVTAEEMDTYLLKGEEEYKKMKDERKRIEGRDW